MSIPGFADLDASVVVREAIKDFIDDGMPTHAAALSFHVLLALFPFIIFLLTLLGSLGWADAFDRILSEARPALPPDVFALLEQVVSEIRGRSAQGLLSVSILFSIWAASAGVRAVMTALNGAYDVAETRPVWLRYPLSILYTLALATLAIIVSGLLIVGPIIATWFSDEIQLSRGAALAWVWLRWPVIVLVLLLTFAAIYKLLPNIDQPFRYVTPGSVMGVLVWIVASLGFSTYVENFGNYGATYGSLGGIVVLLLYFFVSGAALLFGAEINAVIHPASDPLVEAPRDPAQEGE